MPALGLTDHGVLNGAVEFYKACRKHDVKPILGLEAYLVRRPPRAREGALRAQPPDAAGPRRRRLPEPDQALLARLPGGLPPRPGERRHGAAGAPLGGRDRAHRAACSRASASASSRSASRRPAPTPTSCWASSARTTSTSRSRTTRSPSRTGRTRGSCGSRASWAGRWSGRPTSTTCAARTTPPTPRCCACRPSRRSPQPKLRFDTNEFYLKSAGRDGGVVRATGRRPCPTTLEIAERCEIELELGKMMLPTLPDAGRRRRPTAVPAPADRAGPARALRRPAAGRRASSGSRPSSA